MVVSIRDVTKADFRTFCYFTIFLKDFVEVSINETKLTVDWPLKLLLDFGGLKKFTNSIT